jgi:hypothetical protein
MRIHNIESPCGDLYGRQAKKERSERCIRRSERKFIAGCFHRGARSRSHSRGKLSRRDARRAKDFIREVEIDLFNEVE